MKILHKKDICELFGYNTKKMKQLFDSRILQIKKIGNEYITKEEEIIKF